MPVIDGLNGGGLNIIDGGGIPIGGGGGPLGIFIGGGSVGA